MSKIAKQKALEIVKQYDYLWDTGSIFKGYVQGYDQAMQDFMEKACKWLEDTQLENFICRDDGIYFENEKFVEQFKNHMKNELLSM